MTSPDSSQTLFIAGAGTEVGKTYVTAALICALRDSGRPVRGLKPVASGVPPLDEPAFAGSDTARLLAAQGLAVTPGTVEACSPWRFAAPLSPDQAASREGRALALGDLVAWCLAEMGDGAERTLIEGVGGLMSPVTAEATGLDWLVALGCPALLVTGSYLGAISHALTAHETLRLHGVPLVGIVVSQSLDAPAPPETVAEAIRRRVAVPVICLRREQACPDALAALI